jgi:hypothetical protein
MIRFYFILFKYRDLHLIDAHTGEFTRAGMPFAKLLFSSRAPAARIPGRPAIAIVLFRSHAPGKANRGALKKIVRRRFVMLLPSLTHRRRDLLYLTQQYLDFGADIGQDMMEFTLGIGRGVSLL